VRLLRPLGAARVAGLAGKSAVTWSGGSVRDIHQGYGSRVVVNDNRTMSAARTVHKFDKESYNTCFPDTDEE